MILTMSINEFLTALANIPGRNDKIALLEANRDNKLLQDVIRLALDPFKQFYIRKIPEYTQDKNITTLEQGLAGLYELSERIVTGNAAIEHLRMILSSLNSDDAKVIERIIQKDLKCGVQASTVNKVWSGMIPVYPCMLCSGYEERLVKKIKFPALVQTKMDGMRFNAIVRDGKVEFRSRNGKEIQLLGHLEKEFAEMAGFMDCVFDGELLVKEDGKILDRQTGNGILNKANKGTITANEAEKVCATVWDVIPFMYFMDGNAPVSYGERFQRLTDMILAAPSDRISRVTTYEVEDIEEADAIFKRLLDSGEEGIILKDKGCAWENKRAKHQIKFKGEFECDLLIVDTEEGTGKYEGQLGAIVCETSDGKIKVNVGSGFNEDQRQNYTREDLVGKIVAIKYNARIKNKSGEESLFLPIFVEVREDKDNADSAEEVK